MMSGYDQVRSRTAQTTKRRVQLLNEYTSCRPPVIPLYYNAGYINMAYTAAIISTDPHS